MLTYPVMPIERCTAGHPDRKKAVVVMAVMSHYASDDR